MEKIPLLIASFLISVSLPSKVQATAIEYHFNWLASGTATSISNFNDAPFEFVITGNPQDVIQYPGQSVYLNLGSNGLDGPGLPGSVSGFSGAPQSFGQPLYVLNRGGALNGGAGFTIYEGRDQVDPASTLVQMTLGLNSPLQSYDLMGPIGPVIDESAILDLQFLSSLALQTNPFGASSLTLSSARDLTFEAKLVGTPSIPEPATLALLGLGLAGLGAMRRGKFAA